MYIYIYIYYSKAPSRRPANPPVLNHGPRRAHRLPLMNALIGTSHNGTPLNHGIQWVYHGTIVELPRKAWSFSYMLLTHGTCSFEAGSP